MCFTDSKTENAIYIICTLLLFMVVLIMPFNRLKTGALICCVVILLIVACLTIHDANATVDNHVYYTRRPVAYPRRCHRPDDETHTNETSDGDGDGDPGAADSRAQSRLATTSVPHRRPTFQYRPHVTRAVNPPPHPPVVYGPSPPPVSYGGARFAVVRDVLGPPLPQAPVLAADVPGNYLFGETPADELLLPLVMEGHDFVRDDTDVARVPDNVAQCGPGVRIIPNLPPFPGVAQFTGQTVWKLPEWPADQPSREETIAAVVSDLPECREESPKDVIRNKGLYGIKGNVACDLLKRSAVADTGFIQPLGARDAFLAYNTYDQLHAKDQFMIPVLPQKF